MPLYGTGYPLLAPDGSAAAPSYGFASAPTSGFYIGGGAPSISLAGVIRYQFGGGTLLLTGGAQAISLFGDTTITRDGVANTLAMRNGVNAQTQRWYNTYTDASNCEYFETLWSSNAVFLRTVAAGTGVARNMNIGTTGSGTLNFYVGASNRWRILSTGHLQASVDNTYDIGASGATRPRTIYAGTSVESAGYVSAGAASSYGWIGRSQLLSPSNGIIRLGNAAATDFDRLQFGGTTSSFPSLKRSATTLQARLADDSAYASLQGKLTTETAYAAGAIVPTGYLTLYDSNGTAYQVPAVAA